MYCIVVFVLVLVFISNFVYYDVALLINYTPTVYVTLKSIFKCRYVYIKTALGVVNCTGIYKLLSSKLYKKHSYCWETVRRESMPRVAEMDVEMTS